MVMELNKIYLGDAYELIKQVPSKSIDLIVTDPPYQIDGISNKGKLRGIFAKDGHKATYEQDLYELSQGIDLSILDELVRVMKKINIYIWCNKEQIYDYLTYFVEEHNCNWEILILAKTDPIPFCGTHYLVDKEYCLFFWQTGAYVDIPFDRAKTVFIKKRNTRDKLDYKHPTIKLYDLVEVLVKNSSQRGG